MHNCEKAESLMLKVENEQDSRIGWMQDESWLTTEENCSLIR